jgi:DNA-binding XRE family transcriptional regulator
VLQNSYKCCSVKKVTFLFFYIVKNIIFDKNYKMTKFDITDKVKRLRSQTTDEELAKLLGLSRPTLYQRLKDHKWKVSEIFYISKL